MKIVTVNVPESYLDAIDRLTGDAGLYPSRSELIRCAVREFLMKELKMAKKLLKYDSENEDSEIFDNKNYVRVPIENINDKNEPVRDFKTYKIVKRLEL